MVGEAADKGGFKQFKQGFLRSCFNSCPREKTSIMSAKVLGGGEYSTQQAVLVT